MQLICQHCGDNFNGQAGRRYCSRPCSNRANRDNTKVANAARLATFEAAGRTRKGRTCEVCGSTYDATYAEQRTCGRACGMRVNAAISRAKAKRAAQSKPEPLLPMACAECGTTFTPKSRKNRFCSKRCADVDYNRRARSRLDRHVCDCGTVIPIKRKRCDPCIRKNRRAGKHRERARRRGLQPDYKPYEIFERDGWRCHICRRRCSPWKVGGKTYQPRAATIDHLIPLSLGGPDTRVNVATACFRCNSLKSNGSVGEQLAIIG